MRLIVLLVISCSILMAEDQDQPVLHPLVKLMQAMPDYEVPRPQPSPAPEGLDPIIPGLMVQNQKRIYMEAEVIFDQGPQDGLEAIACMPGGKNHESMLLLRSGNGVLINSLFKVHLNLTRDGVPSPQDSGLPARGLPLRVVLRWRPDPVLEPDTWVERDVSTMVRDRVRNRAYPPLPYVYTGSRFTRQVVTDDDGTETEVKIYMLDTTKTLVANYDEPDCLLASPFPLAQFDFEFEVNSADSPESETEAELYFEACELPLTLRMDADGVLYQGERALSNEDVVALLQKHYPARDASILRSLGLEVQRSTSRDVDVQARERLLRLSIDAKTWVVPLFIPAAD